MTKPIAFFLSLKLMKLSVLPVSVDAIKETLRFGISRKLVAESFSIFNRYSLASKFALNSFGLFNSVSAAKTMLTFEVMESLHSVSLRNL